MKKLSCVLFLAAVAAFGQVPKMTAPARVGYCLNPSAQWIPIFTAQTAGAALTFRPQPFPMYGYNGGSNYPVKCDASGNLVTGGAVSGDLSGNLPSPTVVGVNGAALPVSKVLVGTDGSGRIVDASAGAPGGDLGNTRAAPSVVKVNGSALPVSKVLVGTDASGHIVDATTVSLTLAAGGTFRAERLSGANTATIAAGAAISGTGSGYVAPACAASHTCTDLNGTLTFTTGSTAASTGILLTLTNPTAHTYFPDCTAHIVLTSAPYTEIPGYSFSYSTTVWTLNVGTAPATSSAYTVTYVCLGI